MGTGTRQTFYFKTLNGMRRLAEEEGIDLNGSLLEELFWSKYAGTDESYVVCMKNLYDGSNDLKQTLAKILEIMAYSEGHMVKDNINFITIVRDCIGSSDWYNEGENYTDFNIDNKSRFIDAVADIFVILANELEQRKSFVQHTPIMSEIDPWDVSHFPAVDNRYENFLTDPSNYENEAIEAFRFRGKKLKENLQENISPGRVLEIIMENWDFFWPHSCVYELVEYCTILSCINDRPLLRKRIRNFFQEISERQRTVNITVETFKKDVESEFASLRLFEYLNRLKARE